MPTYKLFQLLDLFLLAFKGLPLNRQPFFLLRHIGGVIATEAIDLAIYQFEYLGNGFDQGSIDRGDQQKGTSPFGNVDSSHSVDSMSKWFSFVQDHQIRLLQQQGRQATRFCWPPLTFGPVFDTSW